MGDPTEERPADPDSRVRTHLANERTYLAWLRTGITFIALGLAAGQFLAHDIIPGVPLNRTLAITFVVTGIFVGLAGSRRYVTQARRIEAGEFRPATYPIAVTTVMVVVVGLLAILFILALRR